MKDCNFCLEIGKVNQKCLFDSAILSKITMFHFCNEMYKW